MLLATALTVVVMFMTPQTTGQTEGSTPKRERTKAVIEHCKSVGKAIVFYRKVTWESQDRLGENKTQTRYPERWKGRCAYKRYIVREVWQSEARRLTRLLAKFERDPQAAICYVFGEYCRQALTVAWCESKYSPNAHNGQYLGVFQMGESERARFGHGRSTIDQARAAKRYFEASGRDWSPWQCSPWGGLSW